MTTCTDDRREQDDYVLVRMRISTRTMLKRLAALQEPEMTMADYVAKLLQREWDAIQINEERNNGDDKSD